jgi:hypothetical protein
VEGVNENKRGIKKDGLNTYGKTGLEEMSNISPIDVGLFF